MREQWDHQNAVKFSDWSDAFGMQRDVGTVVGF